MPLEIILIVTIVLTMLTLAMAVAQLITPDESTTSIRSRVEKLSQVPEALKEELKDVGNEVESYGPKSLLGGFDVKPLLASITGEGILIEYEKKLAQADVPMRVGEFFIVNAVVTFLVFMLLWILLKNLIVAFVIAIPVFFLHIPFLAMRRKARINKFNLQLADFLTLTVNALRAGQNFLQGAQIAVNESQNPIAAEFKQVIKEVNLGMSEEESFENMLTRVPSEDLKIVVAAYVIQRKVGGNLAGILETTAQTIRDRIRLKGMIDTLTTQGKISGLIVGGIPFLIFGALTILRPEIASNLWTEPIGWGMIAAVIILQSIGALSIAKIVSIEV